MYYIFFPTFWRVWTITPTPSLPFFLPSPPPFSPPHFLPLSLGNLNILMAPYFQFYLLNPLKTPFNNDPLKLK